MNAEVEHAWIEALRSGEYEQGTGALRDRRNQYCCLGVLCDLFAQEKGDGEDEWENAAPFSAMFRFHGSALNLSERVLQWAELDSDDADKLALYNDDGWSFEQIAHYIKTEL